jgi:hypothetical protein
MNSYLWSNGAVTQSNDDLKNEKNQKAQFLSLLILACYFNKYYLSKKPSLVANYGETK